MSKNISIDNLLKEFKSKTILIVGDVMVDEYLWGGVSRISPEAPVPVVSCTQREHRMGGAANVAINIKALGANPVMCSVIGKDEIGEIYRKLLKKRGMTDRGILSSDKRKTTVKTRVIGNHQHLIRIDHELTDFLDTELEQLLIDKIQETLGLLEVDAIIFQDYDKGVLTKRVIREVINFANAHSIPTLVDPKKRSFLDYWDVTFFKPNFKELTEGLNITLDKSDEDGIDVAVRKLHTEKSIKNVMVTLSEKGVFVSDGKNTKTIPAEERDIADVSGAGDTVISVAALCISSGLTVFQAATLSNVAGGLVCEKVGVIPIMPELLMAENILLEE
jgi:rfaE bifunctional protein kinase chain/domain